MAKPFKVPKRSRLSLEPIEWTILAAELEVHRSTAGDRVRRKMAAEPWDTETVALTPLEATDLMGRHKVTGLKTTIAKLALAMSHAGMAAFKRGGR